MEHMIDLVLQGIYRDDSTLSIIRGNHLVLWKILCEIKKFDYFVKNSIDKNSTAYMRINTYGSRIYDTTHGVKFPPPSDLNINMMPIDISDPSTIPINCQQYIPLIYSCLIDRREPKIVYLTIDERLVETGQSHRRNGVHIERPGVLHDGGRISERPRLCTVTYEEYRASENHQICWGLGFCKKNLPVDGIYMASNIEDSCHIWPVLVDNPEKITDKHGGLEQYRHHLGPPTSLYGNQLYWFTDRTPHESVVLTHTTYRQFFRLVAGKISVWYAQHNTPNPLGVVPDAPISNDNKFG